MNHVHPERPHYGDAAQQHAYLMGAVDAIDMLLASVDRTAVTDHIVDGAHALRDACMAAADALSV